MLLASARVLARTAVRGLAGRAPLSSDPRASGGSLRMPGRPANPEPARPSWVRTLAAAAARPPPTSDDEDEDLLAEELPEDVAATAAGIAVADVPWGGAAADAAAAVLSTNPALSALSLWSLTADARSARLAIRLDKPTDEFGSPSLDEVAAFAAAFGAAFEAKVGGGVADGVEVEVSSPGAERALRVPADLARFGDLPMAVRLGGDASAAALAGGCGPPKGLPPRAPGAPFIFNLVAFDEAAGTVTWRPADVRANRGPTGRLTKAQKEGRVVVAVGDVDGVRLWLDV